MNIKHIYSTPAERMVRTETLPGCGRTGLSLSGERRQTFRGFGGCFNELFCPDGCGFNFGTMRM